MTDETRIWITERKIDQLTDSFNKRYEERKGEMAELNRNFKFPHFPDRFHALDVVSTVLAMSQASVDGSVFIGPDTLKRLNVIDAGHVDKHIEYLRNAVAALEPAKPVKKRRDYPGLAREYLIWGYGACAAALFITWLLSN